MHSTTTFLKDESLMMPAKLRNLVQAPKPNIKFTMHSRQPFYTTLDRIEGAVTVVAPVDTTFDAIEIEFVGTSRTYVERLTTAPASSGRSEAFHQFLKLQQPGLSNLFPEDHVLRAGQTYTFPFVFVIPQQLLLRVCTHTIQNDSVRDAHLRLPPTFGDKNAGIRAENLDDMAPEMASVRYGVFVRISEIKTRGEETWRATVASRARRIRVIPVIEEQPPLEISPEDGDFIARKTKSVRRGMLKGKLGTLTMEAAQPAAFKLHSYNNPEARPTTTMATVMLRFDPAEERSQPPKLGSVAAKLKVATFFACTARSAFPSKNACVFDLSAGVHAEQYGLSSRTVGNVEWKKHHVASDLDDESDHTPAMTRRDSAVSSTSLGGSAAIPAPSAAYDPNKPYYTAHLLVPLTLPTHKSFVPSFHTCLISRIYTLKLDLSVPTQGSGPGLSSSLELKIPVQISSEDLVAADDRRRRRSTAAGLHRDSVDSSNADAEGDIDVDDYTSFFEPRSTRTLAMGLAPVQGLPRARVASVAPTAPLPFLPLAPAYTSTATATETTVREGADEDVGEVHRPNGSETVQEEAPPEYEQAAARRAQSYANSRVHGRTGPHGRSMSVPVY